MPDNGNSFDRRQFLKTTAAGMGAAAAGALAAEPEHLAVGDAAGDADLDRGVAGDDSLPLAVRAELRRLPPGPAARGAGLRDGDETAPPAAAHRLAGPAAGRARRRRAPRAVAGAAARRA